MTTIALLGLGHMGAPMAARLGTAGHQVTVWNRTRAKADALTAANPTIDTAATPAEAAAGAEVVITMLTGPEAVEAVVLGENGATSTIRPGAVLVEMSTIGPTAAAALAGGLPDGVGMVDAPVGGSTGMAERGELTILAGGTDRDVEAVLPVLEALGTVLRCGGPGRGAAAKLVAISAMVSGVTLLGELRAVGAALGLPTELAERLLAAGPMSIFVERAKGTGSHYAAELAAKDLGLTVAHAPAPLVETALDRIRVALPRIGGRDLSTLADTPA